MAGTRHLRSERAGAVVVAALLVLSTLAGVAGVGSAHDDADHITRNGDTLTITLGEEHFNGTDRNVTVSAEGGGSVELTKESKAEGQTTYSIPIADLSKPKTDLSNATVTVNPNDGKAIKEQVNLQLLAFDESTAPTLSGTMLEIPLNRSLGFADESGANVQFNGDSGPVDAVVEYRNDTTVLAVSFAPDQLELPLPDAATIRVPDRDSTDVSLRSLVAEATEIGHLNDETVVVSNPFVVANTEYDLVVNTENPTGTLATNVSANGSGSFTVNDEVLASAGTLRVSAYRGGNSLFENVEYAEQSNEPMTATVESNGTAVALADDSFSAEMTTVWLSNGSSYARTTASVDNGTLDLSSTDYRLHPNGSYQVILAGEQFARAEIEGAGSGNDTLTYVHAASSGGEGGEGSEGGDGPAGFVARVPGGWVGVAGIASAVMVLFGGVGAVLWRKRRTAPNPTRNSAPATVTTEPSVTVTVEDAATGTSLDATVRAAKTKFTNDPHGTEETEVTNGAGSLTLERGKWDFEVESNGVSKRKTVNVQSDKRIAITLGPRTASASVTDDGGEPLSGIAVTCTPGEGEPQTKQTDGRGSVEFSVPFGASEVELAADHEKYEADAATLSFGDSSSVEGSLTLRQLTGELELTATVDGTPVAGLPVEVKPRDDAATELGETHRATTDGSGVAAFDGLLVGTYEARLEFPDGNAFSAQSKRVEVRDGRRSRETLDAPFEFTLGRAERDRITSIRQEVDSLTAASGRDVAVPRYYGSVVTALLDTVERTAREGHRFATADADPDAVVTALIDAAEEGVELIHGAMTTKRNTDLFGACADMPDEWVEWTGSFDADALFELLAEDRTSQRQTVLQRLRSVDDRIDRERSDLAVVAPARELWDGVKEFVNSDRGDDPVRGAAVAFVAIGLLDGVDELFDHEELRDRLERTVF